VQERNAFDREMREGLIKNGLRLNEGLDGSGIAILVFARFGGGFLNFLFLSFRRLFYVDDKFCAGYCKQCGALGIRTIPLNSKKQGLTSALRT